MLAITSVFVAPRLAARFGPIRLMYAMLALISLDLLVLGFETSSNAPQVGPP